MTDPVSFLPGMVPALKGAGLTVPGRIAYEYKKNGWPNPDAKSALVAEVYRKDVVFKMKGWRKRAPRMHERGAIKGFSAESARRLRHLIRNTDDLWTGFMTLTYPGPSFGFAPEKLDGPTCKKQIHAFCTWLGRQKIAYVWVLEFQRRGVPHFHFLVSGFIDKTKIAQKWFDLVGSGDPRHRAAGTNIQAVKNPDEVGIYMSKYMAKLEDSSGFETKHVPEGFDKVGRFWGSSRCLTKTLYRMDGLRKEMARELRIWRKENQGTRRGISNEQAARAAMFQESATFKCFTDTAKKNRLSWARKSANRARGYAKRWRWKGQGFVLLRGANAFRSILRQALVADRGINPWEDLGGQKAKKLPDGSILLWRPEWEEWDGKPAVCKYETEGEKLMKAGEFDLFGGFIPTYPEAHRCSEHCLC